MAGGVYSAAVETQQLEIGHLVQPEHPSAGVVLIPDVWGLSDHYRDLAGRLAGEGFAVLAVDLYRRGKPDIATPAEAVAFIRTLSDPQVLADLAEARQRLAEGPCRSLRIGITGFCMGGQYALLGACSGLGFAACVPFYGMLVYEEGLDPERKPRSPLDALRDLECPVLGLYGEEDALIPLAQVDRLEAALAAAPHVGEVVRYAGAGHAFMNETRPAAYRPAAAADAWPRAVDFLRRHLT